MHRSYQTFAIQQIFSDKTGTESNAAGSVQPAVTSSAFMSFWLRFFI